MAPFAFLSRVESLQQRSSGLQNPKSFLFQFSHSGMSDSLRPHELQHARLPCPLACQASLSIILKSIESVMPSNHLILCCCLLLLPSIFPRISQLIEKDPDAKKEPDAVLMGTNYRTHKVFILYPKKGQKSL